MRHLKIKNVENHEILALKGTLEIHCFYFTEANGRPKGEKGLPKLVQAVTNSKWTPGLHPQLKDTSLNSGTIPLLSINIHQMLLCTRHCFNHREVKRDDKTLLSWHLRFSREER